MEIDEEGVSKLYMLLIHPTFFSQFAVFSLTAATSSTVTGPEVLPKFDRTYVSTSATCSSFRKPPCAGIGSSYGSPLTVMGPESPFNTTSINRVLSPFTHSDFSNGGKRPPSPLPSR